MDEEEGEIQTEDEQMGEGEQEVVPPTKDEDQGETEEENEGQQAENALEDDINITDSQVMIQLKEAEEEAEKLRKEIAMLRSNIDDYNCRGQLSDDDKEILRDLQILLMEKIALLDELTKRIAKLMELAGKTQKSEDATILDEEEEEGLPDDLLPRVVICSSWDDLMPKVVVCMDMKRPGAVKKKEEEDDRDENGLTPEQREALEQERRCMAEERQRLQYQIACMEGEMRVMMRENDMLSRKVALLKAEMENQPPFEFEMSVSATNPPGVGAPKPGNMEMGYGIMGPCGNGAYTMGGTLAPGAEVQAAMAIQPQGMQQQLQYPKGMQGCGQGHQNEMNGGNRANGGRQLPCSGMTGMPGKSLPCPKLQPQEPKQPNPNDWSNVLPPYGKKCRKDFNAAQAAAKGNMCCCNGGGGPSPKPLPPGFAESLLPPGMIKPPMDVNFKVNVQPQVGLCDKRASMDADSRSNKIAQQLQEIEMELKKMQRELCKAKKDKETLKAQQATLNCAKNYIM